MKKLVLICILLQACSSLQTSRDFDWMFHRFDNYYTQICHGKYCIREYFDDCTLFFRLDPNGNPIPSTYRWIFRTHAH